MMNAEDLTASSFTETGESTAFNLCSTAVLSLLIHSPSWLRNQMIEANLLGRMAEVKEGR